MQYNENVIKGKWKELKGNLQKTWGTLTDDEIEKTKGDMKAIGGLIQQRYGENQADLDKKLDDIYKGLTTSKDEALEKTKDSLKN